jgi:hypothetical protein
MTNKTYRFVTVMMVMLLVLGLALTACKSQTPAETVTPPAETVTPPAQTVTPPPETVTPPPETVTPPAAHQPTYAAKTYTNSEYGFSVQYPKDWVEQPQLVNKTVVAAFGISGFIPGMSISVADADAPLTADWIVAQTNSLPETSNGKVTSDITPTTLDDGTPAFQYTTKYNYQAFEILSFGVSTDKGGKRIRAFVWTIDAFSPYDGTLFSEIAHTLSVK